jgi:ectoine hydroxylase-related dioxygenase (phytanoyl-CoA dioxygenase family)
MAQDYLEQYREQGYAVVKGVFSAFEVAELAQAFDRVRQAALAHRASWRHQNVLFRTARDAKLGRIVRLVQWPSYFDAVLQRYRTDSRIGDILAPLVGRDVKQIINQMHWKPQGAAMAEFGYHQDIRFRRPRSAYRDPAANYVQTGIAIDAHTASSGAMTVLPGSHLLGELAQEIKGSVMETAVSDAELVKLGLDPADVVPLEMAPGDVALWHLHLLHGSGPNTGAPDRRFYINGYVRASACDRGEWAFRDGQPCALGEPVLVHYEELYTRPGPLYLDDAQSG